MLHEGTEGVNAGNILLFDENTLSKCKFVQTIRKSEELKYSSIISPELIETDRGYHLVCYRRLIALSQQQREKIGEQWGSGSQNKTVLTCSGITSPKSHSNAGISPKICLFCSSAQKKVKGKEQKLTNIEKVMQYATWLQDQPMLTKITVVDLTSKEAKYYGICRVKYQSEAESTLEGRKTSINVTFSHSHSLWHKERKAHAKAINDLKIYIENQILDKKEAHRLIDTNSYLSSTFTRHCGHRFETNYQ